MIFAIGTPINARCRPWTFDWIVKPDALMISAIDFIKSPRTFEIVKKIGIHEFLNWNGIIICDSGAFSALNRKNQLDFDLKKLKVIYQELSLQDESIIKITLDFPNDKIVSNYKELKPYEVQPVVPYNRLELLEEILRNGAIPEWLFIGRLVPFMRSGGARNNRLFSVLNRIRHYLHDYININSIKLWALGVGAPSLIKQLFNKVDGCDSARWRITGSNMILLPHGGERGVGNRTKWRGTHHRINDEEEKQIVVDILKQIDNNSDGLENLDISLGGNRFPKLLRNKPEKDLPSIATLLNKLRDSEDELSVYDLELILRTSGNLRLIYNYLAALSFKFIHKESERT